MSCDPQDKIRILKDESVDGSTSDSCADARTEKEHFDLIHERLGCFGTLKMRNECLDGRIYCIVTVIGC
jgi:hypothetical protein